MTGQRWDPRYGRGRTGPLQADVPIRLPGGVWGAVPATGFLTYDTNGTPRPPGTQSGPVTGQNRILCQSEWPIPCRWELQFGVQLEGPAPWTSLANTDAFIAHFSVHAFVESASYVWKIPVGGSGPGVYPYQRDVANGFSPTGGTFPLIAQSLRIELERLEINTDSFLADTRWQWSVVPLLGLTSAGWPG